ncbi:hypothetical protein [Streptomyces sp. NPDC093544]|uniref:hypothetical protein n=1 Tax=Streptomyces sp. NPDC093544 TaxID=3155200 RepID=UPI00343A5A5B
MDKPFRVARGWADQWLRDAPQRPAHLHQSRPQAARQLAHNAPQLPRHGDIRSGLFCLYDDEATLMAS